MTPVIRFGRFNLVGGLGVAVQIATVAVLVNGFGVGPVIGTAVGVGMAIVHNFVWHIRWTWRDRMGAGISWRTAFVRFVGANGAVSFIGSVAMMPLLVDAAGLGAVAANLVTIAICGLANFWLGDRVCFRPPISRAAARSAGG